MIIGYHMMGHTSYLSILPKYCKLIGCHITIVQNTVQHCATLCNHPSDWLHIFGTPPLL